jgi:hypothetical protein
VPRVLFLGCNENQLPYLRAARAQGFRVVATDRNPMAPGAMLADRFHPVGYACADELVTLARSEGFGPEDRIFTASAHLAYEGAAAVAEALGVTFPSVAAVHTALDKCRFYARLAEAGLPVPHTLALAPDEHPALDPARAYWLKSDYGKSPRYCWRVTDGRLPERPAGFDAFYRRRFLLQEEVDGRHFRLNLWPGGAAVFERVARGAWRARPDLGSEHDAVEARLRGFVASLGMAGWLTKFDLIERAGVHYVLDLGLDPPMRLRRLCEERGIDFAAAYAALYLRGDASRFPAWDRLHGDAEIRDAVDRVPAPGVRSWA